MTMRNIIVLMLIILSSVSVYAIDYAYNQDQFGNTNFEEGQTTRTMAADNRTHCQPFVAGKTGTIVGIYADGTVTPTLITNPEIHYCIDDALSYPTEGCAGYGGNFVYRWFGSPENVSFNTVKGDLYYFCVAQDLTAGGTSTLTLLQTNLNPTSDDHLYYGVTSQYDLDSPDIIQSEINVSFDDQSSGGFDGFVELAYMFRNFQYCYDTAGDECFSYSGAAGSFSTPATSTKLAGEIFYYGLEDASVTDISMLLTWGTGTAGTETYKFYIYEWDNDNNVTSTLLYNSSSQVYSTINRTSSTGFKLVEHPTEQPFNLESGNYYLVGVRCASGCGSSPDVIHPAHNVYKTTSDWFMQGFQDKNGRMFSEYYASNMSESRDVFFLLTFDDYVWSESVVNCTTVCDTWESPYYLVESFDGVLEECGWSTTEDECYAGLLARQQSDAYFSAYKTIDTISTSVSQYYTVSFTFNPTDMDGASQVSVSMYDSDFTRYIQLIFGEDGIIYNNDDGSAVVVYNSTVAAEKEVNIHVDFAADTFDLWYDSSKVASGLGFSDDTLNIDDAYGIRISSSSAGYEIGTLEIYASDSSNQPLLPDEGVVEPVDVSKSMCGNWVNIEQSCDEDSDCITDNCMPNGKCSYFDFNYCDDNGHKRGSYCMIAAAASCILSSIADLILDNFILFLVFIILLIMLAYVVIHVRR